MNKKVFALVSGIVTGLQTIGVATAMEFKDKQWGGLWDWKDWACTMLGGLVGQAVQIGVVLLIM